MHLLKLTSCCFILSSFLISKSAFSACANFTGNWNGPCELTSNGKTEKRNLKFEVKSQKECNEIEVLETKMKIGDVTVKTEKKDDTISTTHYAVQWWGDQQSFQNTLLIDMNFSHTYFKNGKIDKSDMGRQHIFLDKTEKGLDLTIMVNSTNEMADIKCSLVN